MGVHTYTTEQKLKTWERVEDSQLDELLQEVRQIDSNYYIQTTKYFVRSWFKEKIEVRYQLFHVTGGYDAQYLTAANTKETIIAWLFGFINGSNKAK